MNITLVSPGRPADFNRIFGKYRQEEVYRNTDSKLTRKIVSVGLKDVRTQTFPRTDFFFKLATQKGNDLLKGKQIGGHRLRFGDNITRKMS